MKIFNGLLACSLLTSALGIHTTQARASSVSDRSDPSAIDDALSRFADVPSNVQAEARAKLQKAQEVLTSLCAKDQSNTSSCAYLAAIMKLDEYRKTARHLSQSLYLRTNGASEPADAFTVFGTSFVAGEAGTALAFGALGTAAFQSAGFGAVFAIVGPIAYAPFVAIAAEVVTGGYLIFQVTDYGISGGQLKRLLEEEQAFSDSVLPVLRNIRADKLDEVALAYQQLHHHLGIGPDHLKSLPSWGILGPKWQ